MRGRCHTVKADLTSLAVGLKQGQVEVWERAGQTAAEDASKITQAQPFRRLSEREGHSDLVSAVDLSPSFIVSASWDGCVRLKNRSDGKLLSTFFNTASRLNRVFLVQS